MNGNPSLNIGISPQEVNGGLNSSIGSAGVSVNGGGTAWDLSTGGSSAPNFTGVNPHACVSNVTAWAPTKTAVDDFLRIQYTTVEVRCAITRRIIPAGRPVMLLGGMVISAEAFENWLEEHLAGMIGRRQDVHADNGNYDE